MIAASVGSSAWAATARRASSRSLGVVGGMNPISLPGYLLTCRHPQAKQNPAETVERERDDEQPEPGHQAPHVKIRIRVSTNITKIAVKVTGLPPIRQR